MNEQDKDLINSFAKELTQPNLPLDYITEGLKVVHLSGKAAEARERLEEFRLAELEDKATCHHGFLVGCPTCHRSD